MKKEAKSLLASLLLLVSLGMGNGAQSLSGQYSTISATTAVTQEA